MSFQIYKENEDFEDKKEWMGYFYFVNLEMKIMKFNYMHLIESGVFEQYSELPTRLFMVEVIVVESLIKDI